MTVIHRKVADDHGHRQGDREDTGKGAQRADEHPYVGFRHHVPVTDGGHRDQSPPQSQWYALEIILRIVLGTFRVIDQTGEDHDAKDQEEDQQGQFFGGCAERLDENLQAGRMTG